MIFHLQKYSFKRLKNLPGIQSDREALPAVRVVVLPGHGVQTLGSVWGRYCPLSHQLQAFRSLFQVSPGGHSSV